MLLLLQECLDYIEHQYKETFNIVTIASQRRYERIHFKITSQILTSLKLQHCQKNVEPLKNKSNLFEQVPLRDKFETLFKKEEREQWPISDENKNNEVSLETINNTEISDTNNQKNSKPNNLGPSSFYDEVYSKQNTELDSNMHRETKSTLSGLIQPIFSHTGEALFKCGKCQRPFKWKSELRRHIMVHTGEQPFQCTICGKKFSRNSNLKKHREVHSGAKSFECKICDKKFFHESTLKQHMLIHSDGGGHQCETCEKKFYNISHLKKHILTHTGVKLFKCDICLKSYAHKWHFKKHRATHTRDNNG